MKPIGTIITFYSFKGGVGRSMALANIAALLARRGQTVLCVDFDLEAPGLDLYFGSRVPSAQDHLGLLDMLVAARDGDEPNYSDYMCKVDVGGPGTLDLMTCGRRDNGYPSRVLGFRWDEFFERQSGGDFFERLRTKWLSDFDFVLIDSRTGLTDAGGICTVQLPDILVSLFTTTEQSNQGARDVVIRAQAARQELAYDRSPLVVLPLPSRFDGRTEFEKSREWLSKFADVHGSFFGDWLPKQYQPIQMLERVKIPYVPYFSFGENMPVLTHGISDPESIGFSLDLAARLIASRFGSVDGVLSGDASHDTIEKLALSDAVARAKVVKEHAARTLARYELKASTYGYYARLAALVSLGAAMFGVMFWYAEMRSFSYACALVALSGMIGFGRLRVFRRAQAMNVMTRALERECTLFDARADPYASGNVETRLQAFVERVDRIITICGDHLDRGVRFSTRVLNLVEQMDKSALVDDGSNKSSAGPGKE
jgi:MinD-like ATPase involved in chromosome partitioning or flagellar assembly